MENKRKDGKVPCMIVTQEQYDNELKQPLLDMGFREGFFRDFTGLPLLVINHLDCFGSISNVSMNGVKLYKRFLVKPYNAKVFLNKVREFMGEILNDDKDIFTLIPKFDDIEVPLFTDLKTASDEAIKIANKKGVDIKVAKIEKVVKPEDINIRINSIESAFKFLDREFPQYISGIDEHHSRSVIAFYKLATIAEAWNKDDGFTPDFSDKSQLKYYPCFVYDDRINNKFEKFVYSGTNYSTYIAVAGEGTRLCFKTKKRAEQFGKQFIKLWNYFLQH